MPKLMSNLNIAKWLTSLKKKPVGVEKQSLKKFIYANRWYFLLLTLLVVIVYANSLPNGLSSDDTGLVSEGSRLLTWGRIFQDFSAPFRTFVYSVVYLFAGVTPWLLRLINIFFHLGNTFLIFIIVARLHNRLTALIASCLFAVHPILVESVTWISGGGYAQYTFFFLLSFLSYTIYREQPAKVTFNKKRKYYLLFILFYLIALFSSNRVATLFPIFYIYEFVWGNLKKNWRLLIPISILGLGSVAYFSTAISSRITMNNVAADTGGLFQNPLIYIPFAFTTYFILFIWPEHLTFAHSIIAITPYLEIIRGCFILLLLLITFIGYKKYRPLFFWLAFLAISLAVTLSPFKISWIVAERYIYLGSIAVFTIFGLLLGKIINWKRSQIPLLIAFIIALSLLSFRTMVRNLDWKDDVTLSLSTIRENPRDIVALNFLGSAYAQKGDYNNALKQFGAGLLVDNNNFLVTYNTGYVFYLKKQYPQSAAFFLRALKLHPDSIQVLQKLSEVYFEAKDWDKVIDYTTQETKLSPNNATLNVNLAKAYLNKNDKQKALEYAKKALEIDPQNASAQKISKDISL